MSEQHKLCIGLSLTATWLRGRDGQGAPADIDTIDFYADLARRSEAEKLDFVFKPDTLSVNPAMASKGAGIVELDPTVMLAAIARQLQSLHWASRGRAGWNIVTSIDGAENFGATRMPSPEDRYRKAAEFAGLVRAIWDSHPTGTGTPSPVGHASEFFDVKGPLNVPGHPAGPPPLFQAGASDTGLEFAATPDMAVALELRTDLMIRAQRPGRSADAVRALPGLYFFLAKTLEEAAELHHRAHAHLDDEKRRASFKTVTGVDIGHLAPDQRRSIEMLPPPNPCGPAAPLH